ncbi:MAG: hypothetical protein WCH65_04195 [bacterium]
MLIGSILVLKARSNLLASTISNEPDQTLFAVLTSPNHQIEGKTVQISDFFPNAWVKREDILIFTPTFVPAFTIKLVMGLDV